MPVARLQMPDGSIGRFEVPEGTTPEQAQRLIESTIHEAGSKISARAGEMATADTPIWKRGLVALGRGLTDIGQGAQQIYASAADVVSPRPQNLSGLVTGKDNSRRAEVDAKVAEELALFKPFEEKVSGSSIGRAVGGALPTLLVPAGKLAQGAGAVVGKVAPAIGARIAGSVAADAALMGAGQGALMATDDGESHLANAAVGGAAGAGVVGALNLSGKAAAPVIRAVANRVNPVAAKGAGLAQGGVLTAETVRALEKEGIDVPSLTAEARTRLAQMASDAVQGSPVTAKELARAARLESLPVPIQGTKGQLSKDFSQNQLEQSLVKSTSAGAPLRETFAGQDERLLENLDAFKAGTGAKIANEGDAGRSVNTAVQARIDKSNANIGALYRAAEKKGETLAPVNVTPLAQWLAEHEPEAISAPAINSIKAAVEKIAKKDTFGQPQISVNDLENIRKKAVSLGNDSTNGHFMSEVKKVIDGLTEGVGGEAYQAARSARLQHAMKFEEPGVIQNVVGMKSRTDRSVPFEDVFKKTVINGSIDDLKTLKGTLLANDMDTREAGVQALKDLRGQAMQYLKDAATNNAHGVTSEAALRRAYNQIGPEKMAELFGGNTSKQFANFLDAVKDLKVPPKGTVNTSGTAGELVNWVDRILGFVPGGGVVKAGAKGAAKLAESAKASGRVEEALNPMAGANQAAELAQQNERVKALLDSQAARRFKRGAAALGAAGATQ